MARLPGVSEIDSLHCLQSYIQWAPLYEQVKEITGDKAARHFAFAISKASDCSLCAALFRKEIVDAGGDADRPLLDSNEQALVNFGCSIARHKGNVADHVYNAVARQYEPQQMKLLITFAGLMIATNIFNNVAETEIDLQLQNYLPPVRTLWQYG